MKSSAKGLIIKIATALLIILVGLGSLFLVGHYLAPEANENEISVNIIISDVNANELHNDTFRVKDMTLDELLDEKYDCLMDDGAYGKRLLNIEEIKTDFITSYIAIYVDGAYATVGISFIELHDGIKIELKETKI